MAHAWLNPNRFWIVIMMHTNVFMGLSAIPLIYMDFSSQTSGPLFFTNKNEHSFIRDIDIHDNIWINYTIQLLIHG